MRKVHSNPGFETFGRVRFERVAGLRRIDDDLKVDALGQEGGGPGGAVAGTGAGVAAAAGASVPPNVTVMVLFAGGVSGVVLVLTVIVCCRCCLPSRTTLQRRSSPDAVSAIQEKQLRSSSSSSSSSSRHRGGEGSRSGPSGPAGPSGAQSQVQQQGPSSAVQQSMATVAASPSSTVRMNGTTTDTGNRSQDFELVSEIRLKPSSSSVEKLFTSSSTAETLNDVIDRLQDSVTVDIEAMDFPPHPIVMHFDSTEDKVLLGKGFGGEGEVGTGEEAGRGGGGGGGEEGADGSMSHDEDILSVCESTPMLSPSGQDSYHSPNRRKRQSPTPPTTHRCSSHHHHHHHQHQHHQGHKREVFVEVYPTPRSSICHSSFSSSSIRSDILRKIRTKSLSDEELWRLEAAKRIQQFILLEVVSNGVAIGNDDDVRQANGSTTSGKPDPTGNDRAVTSGRGDRSRDVSETTDNGDDHSGNRCSIHDASDVTSINPASPSRYRDGRGGVAGGGGGGANLRPLHSKLKTERRGSVLSLPSISCSSSSSRQRPFVSDSHLLSLRRKQSQFFSSVDHQFLTHPPGHADAAGSPPPKPPDHLHHPLAAAEEEEEQALAVEGQQPQQPQQPQQQQQQGVGIDDLWQLRALLEGGNDDDEGESEESDSATTQLTSIADIHTQVDNGAAAAAAATSRDNDAAMTSPMTSLVACASALRKSLTDDDHDVIKHPEQDLLKTETNDLLENSVSRQLMTSSLSAAAFESSIIASEVQSFLSGVDSETAPAHGNDLSDAPSDAPGDAPSDAPGDPLRREPSIRRQTYRNAIAKHQRRQQQQQQQQQLLQPKPEDEATDTESSLSLEKSIPAASTSVESFRDSTTSTDSTGDNHAYRLEQLRGDSGYKSLETQLSLGGRLDFRQSYYVPDEGSVIREDEPVSPHPSHSLTSLGKVICGHHPTTTMHDRRIELTNETVALLAKISSSSVVHGLRSVTPPPASAHPPPPPPPPPPPSSSLRRNAKNRAAEKKRSQYKTDRQAVQVLDSVHDQEQLCSSSSSFSSSAPLPSAAAAVAHHLPQTTQTAAAAAKASLFSRLLKSHASKRPLVRMHRDYSIDERSDALFNEFIRHDPTYDTKPHSLSALLAAAASPSASSSSRSPRLGQHRHRTRTSPRSTASAEGVQLQPPSKSSSSSSSAATAAATAAESRRKKHETKRRHTTDTTSTRPATDASEHSTSAAAAAAAATAAAAAAAKKASEDDDDEHGAAVTAPGTTAASSSIDCLETGKRLPVSIGSTLLPVPGEQSSTPSSESSRFREFKTIPLIQLTEDDDL